MRVAVVGSSLAGLAAGALLAWRGCQVTVFEEAPHPGALEEALALQGANQRPGDHLVWGWRTSRALVRLFGALRDRPGATARHLFQAVPTGLQVLGHPHRLDWGPRLAEEVGREFPDSLQAWKACKAVWDREAEALRKAGGGRDLLGLDQAAPGLAVEEELEAWEAEGPSESSEVLQAPRRPVAERPFLDGVGADLPDPLRDVLRGVALAVSWRSVGEVSLPTWLVASRLLTQEVAVLKEGVGGLVRWLAGRLEAAGGSLRLSTGVSAVKLKRKRVTGVVFREGRRREAHPADAVVVAGGEVARSLPWGRLRTQKRRSSGTLASCLIAVDEEVVAEPLAPLAAYLASPGEGALIISHNPARLASAPAGPRHLLTVAWRPDGPEACPMELPEELPKRLERLMPFLPGRWELFANDEAAPSPVRHHPIPEVDFGRSAPGAAFGGLVVATRNHLPGMATTASLTLGVAAAEAVLRMAQSSSTT